MPSHRLAFLAAERRAHDLVARADGQQGRAARDGPVQAAVPAQALGGEDLRPVLAAADQVDVTALGHRVGRAHVDGLDRDARRWARCSRIRTLPWSP